MDGGGRSAELWARHGCGAGGGGLEDEDGNGCAGKDVVFESWIGEMARHATFGVSIVGEEWFWELAVSSEL